MSDIPMTQRQLLKKFNDETRPHFNQELFNRSDDDLIEAMKRVILSCQRDRYFTIRVEKFTVVKKYSEVIKLLREYEQVKIDKEKSRSNGNKNIFNQYDMINLNGSDIMLLIVDYFISVNDGETNPHDNFRVLIALPKIVEKYYYKINGNYLYAMYQIVDGSTYNNTDSKAKYQNVVYKTIFMPTRVFRNVIETLDKNGYQIKAILYTTKLFTKIMPVMEYIFAKYGLLGGIDFMGLSDVIFISCEPTVENEECFYCLEKYGIYIRAIKYIFEQDIVTQTTVMTIYGRITLVDAERQPEIFPLYGDEKKDHPEIYQQILDEVNNGVYARKILSDLLSDWYWLESLAVRYGSKPTTDKGLSVLDSLESIYDLDSHMTLRLPEEDKADIYRVLRWLIREFPQLRLKDNVDISTKKVRREDYIAAMYGIKRSQGIYIASDSQKKITVEDLKRYINIDPTYLLGRICKDKIIAYRDSSNDNDAFIALKFSYKGISGLGEKNSTVPDVYKHVHPSHLGRIDIDTSSAGDPGMTGLICPMAQISNRSFADDDYQEPNGWNDDFKEMVSEYSRTNARIQLVTLQKELGVINKSEANQMLDTLEFTMQNAKSTLETMGAVDSTAEIHGADIMEDGTMIVYTMD